MKTGMIHQLLMIRKKFLNEGLKFFVWYITHPLNQTYLNSMLKKSDDLIDQNYAGNYQKKELRIIFILILFLDTFAISDTVSLYNYDYLLQASSF